MFKILEMHMTEDGNTVCMYDDAVLVTLQKRAEKAEAERKRYWMTLVLCWMKCRDIAP